MLAEKCPRNSPQTTNGEQWTRSLIENAKQHVRSRPERHQLASARSRRRRTAQVGVVGVDFFFVVQQSGDISSP